MTTTANQEYDVVAIGRCGVDIVSEMGLSPEVQTRAIKTNEYLMYLHREQG